MENIAFITDDEVLIDELTYKLSSCSKDSLVVLRTSRDSSRWGQIIGTLKTSSGEFITIEKTNQGFWFMLYSNKKMGCPCCLQKYHNQQIISCKFIDNKETINAIITTISKSDNRSKFQHVYYLSNQGKFYEYYLFPHYDCPICCSYFNRSLFKQIKITKEKEFRAMSSGKLKKILNNLPIGRLSIFKEEKIFKYKEVYISRIEINILNKLEFGVGRSFSDISAQQISRLEVFERLSLNANIGTIMGTNAKISELSNVLNPSKLDSNISFVCDKGYHWVAGVHLNSKSTVFIPSQLIFFEEEKNLSKREEPRIYAPNSVGTALGGTNQEAIFFAISEYLERHNGLKAWNDRGRLVRWNLKLFKDDSTVSKFLTFFSEWNCKVHIINTTNQCSTCITTVWIQLVWDDGQLNALGSSIEPNKAIESALYELFTGFLNFKNLTEQQTNRMNAMNQSIQCIKNMEDHVLFYRNPINKQYFDFIETLSFDDDSYVYQTRISNKSIMTGIVNTLNSLILELDSLNHDVYTVNITPPLIRKLHHEFSVFKVIISNTYRWDYGFKRGSDLPHPFL